VAVLVVVIVVVLVVVAAPIVVVWMRVRHGRPPYLGRRAQL
jgi:hypothetical protein